LHHGLIGALAPGVCLRSSLHRTIAENAVETLEYAVESSPSKVEYGGMTIHAHNALEMIIEAQRKLDYPDLASDKYFEIFAAYQVLKSNRFNPDAEEVQAGVFGGDGDGGVDGFYVFGNRRLILEDTDLSHFKGQRVDIEVVVVQAKNKPSFEESVPMKFKDFVENCLLVTDPNEVTKRLYSSELISAVARFQRLYESVLTMKPTLSVSFYHVAHSDNIDAKVSDRGNILCDYLKGFYPTAQCSYVPVKGSDLVKMFQKREESVLPLRTDKRFDLTSFGREAYGCVVKLGDFYSFISSEGEIREPLFEANVRDHQPDTTVNEGIQSTLANPAGDDFWWLNNGITILATEAVYSSGSLQITNPLIVNGLQTSHELFRHFKGGAHQPDDRSIMVKVIVNDNDATSDRIIRATNSQTKINSIFLHSTEQIHRNIEVALVIRLFL
jgi:hypothetical protein